MLKLTKKAIKGKDIIPDEALSYLKNIKESVTLKCNGSGSDHFLNIDNVEEAITNGVAYRLINLSNSMQDSKASKKNQVNLVFSQDIVEVCQAHIRLISLRIFRMSLKTSSVTCKNLLANMEKLCLIYGLNQLYNDCNSCFESGYFQPKVNYSKMLLDAIKTTNEELRPQILNIIESIGISDNVLCSAVGNSYGDIYETHLEWAQNSKLNKTPHAIPDGYMEYIMPILKAKL